MPDLHETAAKSWSTHSGDTSARVQPIRDTTGEPPSAASSGSVMPSLGEAMEAVESYVKQHPMQVLIGAVTVGAIVALAVSNRRRPSRSDRWMRDIGRTTSEMQRAASREARSLLREVRKSRVGNGMAEDLSSALSPIVSRIVAALGTAKDQASDTVSSVAKSAGLK